MEIVAAMIVSSVADRQAPEPTEISLVLLVDER
jgi:hypothetical protein